MTLSPEEARESLEQVEAGRKAARLALRRSRGHYHLWIWGVYWVVAPLTFHFTPHLGPKFFWILGVAGAIASPLVGMFVESSRVRMPFNTRFAALIGLLVLFSVVWLKILGASDWRQIYAYFCTIAMFGYIAAGLWFDVYLVWVGIAATALTLVGYFAFGPWFWLWMAVAGGGTLIGTGFYVRYFWKD